MKYAIGIIAIILFPVLIIAALYVWRKSKRPSTGSSLSMAPKPAATQSGNGNQSNESGTRDAVALIKASGDTAEKLIATFRAIVPDDSYTPDGSEILSSPGGFLGGAQST